MITEDPITSINIGNDTTFEGSWIYQWLNEDFLDSLYNYGSFIDTNASWNATTTTLTTKPAETTMVTAPVGFLNTYEYVNSYAILGSYNTSEAYENGYLNSGYEWWLTTPYNNSTFRFIERSGLLSYNTISVREGVRPSVYLKSGIITSSGNGTKTNPYKISGDKNEAISNTTLLNTRTSGEYVIFKNE